ncbi:MAG: cupredoxin domain-containing protein [Armatimonadetes bacterium]|nr:cupredoxin domain-containing protein [Armatimonadota bacterium]
MATAMRHPQRAVPLWSKGAIQMWKSVHTSGLLAAAVLIGTALHVIAAPAVQEVRVSLKEWAIDPKEVTVTPGRVRFVLRNEGRRQHTFGIIGPGSSKDLTVISDNVRAGQSLNFEVDLPGEGTYTTICDIEGHRERGMEGRLIVRR